MTSTAGRLMMAPVRTISKWVAPLVNGALVSASGRWNPSCSTRLTTYPDQPTATVPAANRYSRIRFQPMNQATPSPSVAYEYEYALPETGIIAENSA
jgi:hypothetical protein